MPYTRSSGNEFPLLIKFIEAREDLSIQVHPGNELARERHNAYGKTEMWYILESESGSKIYTGFREGVTKEMYQASIMDGTIAKLLNVEHPEQGTHSLPPQEGCMPLVQERYWLRFSKLQTLPTGYLTGTGRVQVKKKGSSIQIWHSMQLTLMNR